MQRAHIVKTLPRTTPIGALVVVIGAAMAAPDEARACSCGEPGLYDSIPSNSAVDVVRNARVFVADPAGELTQASFVDDNGGVIDAVVTHIDAGDASTSVFAPSELLQANRAYTLLVGPEFTLVDFTTGEDVDEDPPPAPDVRLTSTWSTRLVTSSCGPGTLHGASFDVVTLDEAAVLLAQRGSSSSDVGDDLEGAVTRVFTRGPVVELGSGGCASGWPEATGGAEERFSFAFIDRAGHFSGWSEPIDVVLPMTVPAFACAHTTTSARHPTGTLSFLVVLALLRRRLSPR